MLPNYRSVAYLINILSSFRSRLETIRARQNDMNRDRYEADTSLVRANEVIE
jgi:hypothetical protein